MSAAQTKKLKPNRLEYTGKMILAPMVKVGTLPMRLLALQYGADIVYSEEIIDWKLINSVRIENKLLGTIDYVDKTDNTLVFRTCPQERGHLVLQIGTSDGDRAAKVARFVEQDIDGIDVNMGCPKSFSLKGGMGAALLTQPEKIEDILTKIRASVSIPVTCKIRIFSDVEKSVELVQRIERTGAVAAIGVHGRTKDQRPNDENNVEAIKRIVEATNLTVIANGGSSNNRNSSINTYSGIRQFWKESKASSVMIARAAEWNVSVFRDSETLVDIMTVINQYLDIAIKFDYPFLIVKYCVQQMLGSQQESELGKLFLESATMADLCKVFGLESKYRSRQKELGLDGVPDYVYSARTTENGKSDGSSSKPLEEGLTVTEMFCPFIRAHYGPDNCNDLPKSRLLNYARQRELNNPVYKVYQEDKKFRAIVSLQGVHYSSLSWEKNKRYAEQASAIVANLSLGISSPEFSKMENKMKNTDDVKNNRTENELKNSSVNNNNNNNPGDKVEEQQS